MVECALAELGVDYQFRSVDLRSGEQRTAAYRALNPQGKVPALTTPEGDVLTESAAILLTLDERYPLARLLPARSSRARTQALRWLLFVATELYPIVEIYDFPERFSPGPEHAASVRAVASRIWRERWAVMEAALREDPFLLGDEPCVTDFAIAVVSRWDADENWVRATLPAVQRLTEAVAARPLIAPVWSRHHPPGAGGWGGLSAVPVAGTHDASRDDLT